MSCQGHRGCWPMTRALCPGEPGWPGGFRPSRSTEHQRQRDREPVRRERHSVQPAHHDDERDVDHAHEHAVGEQPGEVCPRGQRRRPDPLEYPGLPAGRERDRELAVARAEYRQRGDRRHVILQRGQPAKVRALPAPAEERAHDNHEHDREDKGEYRALRVPPERQLLVPHLMSQQAQVAARAGRRAGRTASTPAGGNGGGHRMILSGARAGAPSRVSSR